MAGTDRYVLALDLGSSLGWALSQGSKIINSGIYDLKAEAKRSFGSDHRAAKKLAFQEFLNKFVMVHEVVFEDIRGLDRYGDTFFLYNLIGDLEMFCFGSKKPMGKIHSMTLKKGFTGSGKASKEDMCEQAHSMGWKGGKHGTARDNDEADAIALLVVHSRNQRREVSF